MKGRLIVLIAEIARFRSSRLTLLVLAAATVAWLLIRLRRGGSVDVAALAAGAGICLTIGAAAYTTSKLSKAYLRSLGRNLPQVVLVEPSRGQQFSAQLRLRARATDEPGELGPIAAVGASVDTGHFGAGRYSVLPRATAALAPHIADGEVVVFHPEFDRVVGYYYGLPRKPPLQMALWHDRAVLDLDTLDLPRPATLWMIGVYEEPRSYTGLALDEQGRQLEAFGAWYGHAPGGREAARRLQPGNTFAARFDETGVRLRVIEHPSEAARAIAELRRD